MTYNAYNLTTTNKAISTTNCQSCCKSTKAISGEILEQKEGDMSDCSCNYQIRAGTTYSSISTGANGQILFISTQSIQIINLEVGRTTCQITVVTTKQGQKQRTTLAHAEARPSVSKTGHAVQAEEKKGSKEAQLWRRRKAMCQITLAATKRGQAQRTPGSGRVRLGIAALGATTLTLGTAAALG